MLTSTTTCCSLRRAAGGSSVWVSLWISSLGKFLSLLDAGWVLAESLEGCISAFSLIADNQPICHKTIPVATTIKDSTDRMYGYFLLGASIPIGANLSLGKLSSCSSSYSLIRGTGSMSKKSAYSRINNLTYASPGIRLNLFNSSASRYFALILVSFSTSFRVLSSFSLVSDSLAPIEINLMPLWKAEETAESDNCH